VSSGPLIAKPTERAPTRPRALPATRRSDAEREALALLHFASPGLEHTVTFDAPR